MILLSVGDRIRSGFYRLHSRFSRAVNFTGVNGWVSVVDEKVGGGPLNIVVRNGDFRSIRDLKVAVGAVLIGNQQFHFSRRNIFRSEIEIGRFDRRKFRLNLAGFEKLLVKKAPSHSLAFLFDRRRLSRFRRGFERQVAVAMATAVKQIFSGDLRSGVKRISGCGFGLTPSGDDFLAGLLAGLHVLEKITRHNFAATRDVVFRAAGNGNVFSAAGLRSAYEGCLFERFRNLIGALADGSLRDVTRQADKVFAIGETSGADMATGFLMTMKHGEKTWS